VLRLDAQGLAAHSRTELSARMIPFLVRVR
jgi:hypothetical protein